MIVRTTMDADAMLTAVKRAVQTVNPDQVLSQEIFTVEEHVERILAPRRFNAALMTLFGILGVVIAAAGIYSVLAYTVAQRTGEIGVRMALGATPKAIMAAMVEMSAKTVFIGIAIGAGVSWMLGSVVQAFLFDVRPTSPLWFLCAVLVLTVASLVASVIPARRAARIDPVRCLRQG
jgi:ABC-type antimicrobial peptide transport system permease subunit